MKISLVALTVAVAGLSAAPVNQTGSTFEAKSTAAQVIKLPPLELNPHALDRTPIPLHSLRQRAASAFGIRLNRLDDRVTDLKGRADLLAVPGLNEDFDRLKMLRIKVATALFELRDPSVGLNAAEHAVLTSINELEIAIEATAATFERLDGVKVQPIS